MVHHTQRRKRQYKMRGGMSSMMPGSINDFNHGNFAATQASAGSGAVGATTNVSLAQSGGKSKKWYGGSLSPLQPLELEPATVNGQNGGYLSSVFKTALAPLGLAGLNKYTIENAHKRVFSKRRKSRLSKRLRRHRHRGV